MCQNRMWKKEGCWLGWGGRCFWAKCEEAGLPGKGSASHPALAKEGQHRGEKQGTVAWRLWRGCHKLELRFWLLAGRSCPGSRSRRCGRAAVVARE